MGSLNKEKDENAFRRVMRMALQSQKETLNPPLTSEVQFVFMFLLYRDV